MKIIKKVLPIICMFMFFYSIGSVLAVNNQVCAGSVITYSGTYFRQDAIYPEGYSEPYSLIMTTLTFDSSGNINGTLNNNSVITNNTQLTNVCIPTSWLMHDPSTNNLMLPNGNRLFYLSKPTELTALKSALEQKAIDNWQTWTFYYSGLVWTLEGRGVDLYNNPWTYTGIIEYDVNAMLVRCQETLIITSSEGSAVSQYLWSRTGITPGAGCASTSSGSSGSESDSASLGLGGFGSIVYLGILLSVGYFYMKHQKKHE